MSHASTNSLNGRFVARHERVENHGALVRHCDRHGGVLRDDGAFGVGTGHGLVAGLVLLAIRASCNQDSD